MPRRVQQVDVNVFPAKGHTGRVNGDAAFLFFRVIIRGRCAFVHHANSMFCTAVEQHTFSDGGFTGIDMGNDSDVS